jgi:uncharacterized membrane protein
MIGLGDLPGADFASSAADVSADGRVIVGSSATDQIGGAFIWDAFHGMRNLQQVLIDEHGLANQLAGWQLLAAKGISADGLTIVGDGFNPDGNLEAWLVRLNPIPEPSTLLLAGATAVCVAGWAAWRRLRRAAD